jgi:hypothetical protein
MACAKGRFTTYGSVPTGAFSPRAFTVLNFDVYVGDNPDPTPPAARRSARDIIADTAAASESATFALTGTGLLALAVCVQLRRRLA